MSKQPLRKRKGKRYENVQVKVIVKYTSGKPKTVGYAGNNYKYLNKTKNEKFYRYRCVRYNRNSNKCNGLILREDSTNSYYIHPDNKCSCSNNTISNETRKRNKLSIYRVEPGRFYRQDYRKRFGVFVVELSKNRGDVLSTSSFVTLVDKTGRSERVRILKSAPYREDDGSEAVLILCSIDRKTNLNGSIDVSIGVSSEMFKIKKILRKNGSLFIDFRPNQTQFTQQRSPGKKRKLHEISNMNLENVVESAIHFIHPSSGDVKGGTYVDILFSINESEYFKRLRSYQNYLNERIVKFETNFAQILSLSKSDELDHRHNSWKTAENSELSEKICFVLVVTTPPRREVGLVDVSLKISEVLMKEKGYQYFRYENESGGDVVGMTQYNNNLDESGHVFEEDDVFDHDVFEEDVFLNALFAAGSNYQYEEDIFGGTIMYYAVAKGDINLVKYLLEKGFNPFHRDICGYQPIDVARHFKRDEMMKLFKNVETEREGKYAGGKQISRKRKIVSRRNKGLISSQQRMKERVNQKNIRREKIWKKKNEKMEKQLKRKIIQ